MIYICPDRTWHCQLYCWNDWVVLIKCGDFRQRGMRPTTPLGRSENSTKYCSKWQTVCTRSEHFTERKLVVIIICFMPVQFGDCPALIDGHMGGKCSSPTYLYFFYKINNNWSPEQPKILLTYSLLFATWKFLLCTILCTPEALKIKFPIWWAVICLIMTMILQVH